MLVLSYVLITVFTMSEAQKTPMTLVSELVDIAVNYEYVLAATKNNNIYIIDVREPKEIEETGKIPNSINIPVAEVENALANFTDSEFQKKYSRPKPIQNTEIIFTCRTDKRSGMALETAIKLGFTKAKKYQGGWIGWSKHNA